MNLAQIFSRKRSKPSRSQLLEQFFGHEVHQWFARDHKLKRLMQTFTESWDESVIEFLAQNQVLFVRGEGHLACAVTPKEKTYLIIVYPDLEKILRSASPIRGLAILAHELGHLFLRHDRRSLDPLEAQIEADTFAFHLGFGLDLEQVLLEYDHSLDCRVRIARLTQLYYSQKTA